MPVLDLSRDTSDDLIDEVREQLIRLTYVNEQGQTITAEVPVPPKKPDTTPEVVATYCVLPMA